MSIGSTTQKVISQERRRSLRVEDVKMTATFPKSHERGRLAVFEWPDGLVATCPIDAANSGALPHDLIHYLGEAQFRPPYGFWGLASQQAPFASLTLVKGAWPRGRREWLDRVRRKHGVEMFKAEVVELGNITDPNLDMDRYWPVRARTLRNAYSYAAENPFANATRADFVEARERAIALHDAWRRVPFGGALVVSWPPDTPPRILGTYDASAFSPLRRRESRRPALRR